MFLIKIDLCISVVTRYMAGPQNRPSPFANQATRDSMSHNWRGPGFYLTAEKRFALLRDTTNIDIKQDGKPLTMLYSILKKLFELRTKINYETVLA